MLKYFLYKWIISKYSSDTWVTYKMKEIFYTEKHSFKAGYNSDCVKDKHLLNMSFSVLPTLLKKDSVARIFAAVDKNNLLSDEGGGQSKSFISAKPAVGISLTVHFRCCIFSEAVYK